MHTARFHVLRSGAGDASRRTVKEASRYTTRHEVTEINMADALAEIEAKIGTLGTEEKVELIRALIADFDGPPDADVERAWLEEAQR